MTAARKLTFRCSKVRVRSIKNRTPSQTGLGAGGNVTCQVNAMSRRTSLRSLVWPMAATVLGVVAHVFLGALLALVGLELQDPTLDRITGAFAYFAGAWLGSRLIGIALERVGPTPRRVPKLLKELITAVLFFAATIATLVLIFGQSLSGALAGSGIIIAVIGFALRNVIADLFSGIALGLEAPYRIGDAVAIDSFVRGRVVEIGWRTTRILTPDSKYAIIPNSQIAKLRLTNYSAPQSHYRVQAQITIGHDVPIETTKNSLLSALKATASILVDPAPDVRVMSFSADGIVYAARFWIRSFAEEIDTTDAVLTAIDDALRRDDIPRSSQLVRIVGQAVREDVAGPP